MRVVHEQWPACHVCAARTSPSWFWHTCQGKVTHGADGSEIVEGKGTKHWNFETGYWEVMPPRGDGNWHHFQGLARYDQKGKIWVRDYTFLSKVDKDLVHSMYVRETNEELGYEVMSCEMPSTILKKEAEEKKEENKYGWNGNTYIPIKPWEGVNRLRWENTWQKLVQLYYADDWHHGKYIDNEVYARRIFKGEYVPEPKYPYRESGSYHYTWRKESPQGETYEQWLERTERQKREEEERKATLPVTPATGENKAPDGFPEPWGNYYD